jgi:hypothetical protein
VFSKDPIVSMLLSIDTASLETAHSALLDAMTEQLSHKRAMPMRKPLQPQEQHT